MNLLLIPLLKICVENAWAEYKELFKIFITKEKLEVNKTM